MDIQVFIGLLLIIALVFIVFFSIMTYAFHTWDSPNEKPKECACNHECQAADCPCPTVPCGPDCKCKREDVFGF